MKATFFLKTQSTNSIIQIAVTLAGKRVKSSTGLKIDASKWSNGYPLRSQTLIREQLNELQRLVMEHLETREVTPLTIKAIVDKWKGLDSSQTSSVTELINVYLEYKKDKVKPITYKKIESDLSDFDAFKPTKQIADLSEKLIENYISSLNKKGSETSTLNNYLKNLKALFLWSYKKKLTPDIARYINKLDEIEKEIIAINTNELQQLEQRTNKQGKEIQLSERLERVLDAFLFGCYTGLRFSDLERVTSDMINADNEIVIRQQKTGNVVVIPLLDESISILNKYGGALKMISGQKSNDYLKEIFSLLEIDRKVMKSKQIGVNITDTYRPLNEIVSFHIARKSFVTIALSRGMIAKTVQSISGHKQEDIFNRYIAFSADTRRKEINKMSLSSRSMRLDKEA